MSDRDIDKIFNDALDCDPEDRDAFLEKACTGDEALRAQVESLLAHHGKSGGFLQPPQMARAPHEGGARHTATEVLPHGERFTPGQLLGDRYRMEALLGRGGMGEVWRAYDLKLRVDVALKCLHRELFTTERGLELLRHEVRSARNVMSPHVCRIFDLVAADGQELVSMEYIDGRTLQDLLRENAPLELREAGEIVAQLLAGLEAIHAADLIHRDVKPANVMITRAGRVVLMDFGLAKGLTEVKEGSIAGTPAYMAPEQARGAALDARADIFATGVILAEMITTRDKESREALWAGVRKSPAKLPQNPWEDVLRRAVAWDPNARFASSRDMARALEEVSLRAEGVEERTPYPGLNSFTEQDAEYFFGREAEVEAVWKKLQRLHLLAIIGLSGVGKSSFLRAGLIPSAPQDWRCLVCTPGSSPFKALAQTMVPEITGDAEAMGQLLDLQEPGVATTIFGRWRRRHGEALLILDQFEELFTLNPPEVQSRFTKMLGELALEADVHVLLSLRDDFLFHCQEHTALQSVFADLTLMGTLTGSALRRALVQPALACGYRYEDDALVDEMVHEVSDERGALPLLAFAAASMWDHRDRTTGTLTRKAYQRIGGVGGALAKHAEATLERIGPPRHPIVREIFRNLVTAQGTRAVRVTEELLTLFEDREEAQEVLRQLIEARLLTSFDVLGAENGDSDVGHRVEIIHESLLTAWPRLVRWRTQDAEGAQLHDQLRQAAQLWQERSESDDLLWTGTAYKEFELWRERYEGGLTETERAFAEAMEARSRRQRRRRRIAVTSAFMALLAVLLVVGVSRQQVAREAKRATAKHLFALGRAQLDEDRSASLAFAIASLEQVDDPAVRSLAQEILWKGPTAFPLPLSPTTWGVDFSPDGKWLAEGLWDNTVRLWHADGHGPTVLEGHTFKPQRARFEPSSRFLLTGARFFNGGVCVWALPGGELLRKLDVGERVDAFWRGGGHELITGTSTEGRLLRWQTWSLTSWEPTELGYAGSRSEYPPDDLLDPTGRWLVAWQDRELYLHELDSLKTQPGRLIGRHETEVLTATFDASGERIASIDVDGEIRLWSLTSDSGEPLRTLGRPRDPLGLRFDPSGSILASMGLYAKPWLWDLTAPPDADPLQLPVGGQGMEVAFHPDGRWVATTSEYGSTTMWPLTRPYVRVLRGHEKAVAGVVFGPDGDWLASVSGDGTLRIWPLAPDSALHSQILSYGGPLNDLDVDASGRHLLVGGERKHTAIVSLNGGEARSLGDFELNVTERVALSPTGRFATAYGQYGETGKYIHVWDFESETMQRLELDEDEAGGMSRLQFMPDGRLLSASRKGLRLWDLTDGGQQMIRAGEVWDMDVDASGRLVLSSGEDGVLLHDLDLGTSLELEKHAPAARCALDPAGELVVTVVAGDRDQLRVGPATGEKPHLLLRHEGGVDGVDIDPKGRWIAAGGPDGTVRLWPIPTGKPFHTLPYEEYLDRLGSLTNLRVVPDDRNPNGYRVEALPFSGWGAAPTW